MVVTSLFLLSLAAPAPELAPAPPGLLLLDQTDGAGGDAAAGSHKADMLGAQRTLKLLTGGLLLATALEGIIAGINQETLFGAGNCNSGGAVFGTYGCNHFSTIHGITGALTLVSYSALATVSLSIPDAPDTPIGGRPGISSPLYHALCWVVLGGFILQPLLGFTARYPGLIGLEGDGARDYSKTVRTIHMGVGALTLLSYATTVIYEYSE